jgi:hypothetical protein
LGILGERPSLGILGRKTAFGHLGRKTTFGGQIDWDCKTDWNRKFHLQISFMRLAWVSGVLTSQCANVVL